MYIIFPLNKEKYFENVIEQRRYKSKKFRDVFERNLFFDYNTDVCVPQTSIITEFLNVKQKHVYLTQNRCKFSKRDFLYYCYISKQQFL